MLHEILEEEAPGTMPIPGKGRGEEMWRNVQVFILFFTVVIVTCISAGELT